MNKVIVWMFALATVGLVGFWLAVGDPNDCRKFSNRTRFEVGPIKLYLDSQVIGTCKR
nr:hypothetical protein BdHM001_35500 [Bdellovibrio sp. HM001]